MKPKTLPYKQYSKQLHSHSAKGRTAFRAKFNPGPKTKIRPKSGSKHTTKKTTTKAPVNPLAPLDARGLQSNVSSAVNLKYGPQLSQLRGSVAQMPSLYEQYRQNLAGYQANTNQNYAAALQQTQQAAQNTQNNASSQISQIQRAEQADAARRGGASDPNLLAQASQAATGNAQQMNNVGTQFARQGANANDYYNRQQANIAPAQIGQTNIANAKMRNLRSEAGDYAQQTRQDLVDKERQFALNSQLAGFKQTQAAIQTQTTRRGQTLSAKTQKRAQNLSHRDRVAARLQGAEKDRYQRQHHLGPYKPASKGGKGGGKDGGGLTDTQLQSNQNLWQNIRKWVKDHPHQFDKEGKLKDKKPGPFSNNAAPTIPNDITKNSQWVAVARRVNARRARGLRMNPGDRKFLKQKGVL